MKRAIVTGATSFIGCSLVKYLLSEDVQVFAIVRSLSKNILKLPKHLNLTVIDGDLSDCKSWFDKIKQADVFFHLGWDGIGAQGRANPIIQARNVINTKECIKYANILGCRTFLFAGSQAEYGTTNEAITEATPCNAISEYGKGKREVLDVAIEMMPKLHLNYIHTRIFSVYGVNDHEWALVPSCIRAFCQNKEIELSSCIQMWNFLYVDDCAKMLYMLAKAEALGKCEVFNIASDITRPLYQFVEEIKRLCGAGKPLYNAREIGFEPPFGVSPIISKFINVTGYRPTITFANGIKDLILVEKAKGSK